MLDRDPSGRHVRPLRSAPASLASNDERTPCAVDTTPLGQLSVVPVHLSPALTERTRRAKRRDHPRRRPHGEAVSKSVVETVSAIFRVQTVIDEIGDIYAGATHQFYPSWAKVI